jgi:hypothetical protein
MCCQDGMISGALSTSGQVEMTGELKMIGTWDNALGLPMLHLSDIIIGATIEPLTAPPFVKVKALQLGGQICLGKEDSCLNSVDLRFIRGLAYGGFDIEDPVRRPHHIVVCRTRLDYD